jgi:extracellular factor (EF) 3-hydroxypalmitic acid methyl ester biosynthesis protein
MGTIVARQALGLNEALREAARVAAELRRCAALPRGDAELRYLQYVSLMHALLAALRRCEMTGATPRAIRVASAEARQVHRLSPLCTRLQDWPRGYPGDFETVEYLCDGVNRAPTGSFGHAVEAFALRSAAAQQQRNTVEEQASVVARRLAMTTGSLRILSIGCGGSRDLLALRGHCADPRAPERLSVTLIDRDAGALALSERRLRAMGVATQPLAMNVPGAMRLLVRDAARFDLVLAGGLFDYLDDRTVSFVIRTCRRALLRPGGQLFFTNIAAGNPYRPWMDHVANWALIHRSEADILSLAGDDANGGTSVRSDVSGLALLATVSVEWAGGLRTA